MGRIVVVENVTLDGVMQAPGRPDEDRRGGFEHGGWAAPYGDEVMGRVMGQRMAAGGAGLLLGRRTYEDLYGYWPRQTDNPYTEVLNRTAKYVASTTLREPPPWSHSTLLAGDAAVAVAELKERVDGTLTVLGSGVLVHALAVAGLVDEWLLSIHPLVLGSGRRLFEDGAAFATLELVESGTTTTGVLIAAYRSPSRS